MRRPPASDGRRYQLTSLLNPNPDRPNLEVTADQPCGLVAGAQGTVVAAYDEACSVEFLGPEGFAVGIFELPMRDLEVVWCAEAYGLSARED